MSQSHEASPEASKPSDQSDVQQPDPSSAAESSPNAGSDESTAPQAAPDSDSSDSGSASSTSRLSTAPKTTVSGKGKGKAKPKKEGLWHAGIKPILEVVVVVFLFRALIVDWNDVPSGSMLPTIEIGDRIMVNRLAYGLNLPIPFLRHDGEGKGFLDLPFTEKTVPMPLPGQPIRWSDPKRGDIVIVWSPAENGPLGTRLVKRCVAVPGDTVEVRDGVLYINGESATYTPIGDPYLQEQDAAGHARMVQSYVEAIDDLQFEHVAQMPYPIKPGDNYEQWQKQQKEKAVKKIQAQAQLINLSPDQAQKMYEEQIKETIGAVGNLHPLLRNMDPITLPDGKYMCMGDNREFSNDCRIFGPVDRRQIVGRAFRVAMSFDGGMTNPDWDRFFKKLD